LALPQSLPIFLVEAVDLVVGEPFIQQAVSEQTTLERACG
jgi:hypothetical protein